MQYLQIKNCFMISGYRTCAAANTQTSFYFTTVMRRRRLS